MDPTKIVNNILGEKKKVKSPSWKAKKTSRDVDGDGVPNWKDCQPRNPVRQDTYREIVSDPDVPDEGSRFADHTGKLRKLPDGRWYRYQSRKVPLVKNPKRREDFKTIYEKVIFDTPQDILEFRKKEDRPMPQTYPKSMYYQNRPDLQKEAAREEQEQMKKLRRAEKVGEFYLTVEKPHRTDVPGAMEKPFRKQYPGLVPIRIYKQKRIKEYPNTYVYYAMVAYKERKKGDRKNGSNKNSK